MSYVYYKNDLKNKIIAMDNALAKQSTKMSVEEQRLFYIILAHIEKHQTSNIVTIEKQNLINILQFKSSAKWTRIIRLFENLGPKTWISFKDEDQWESGPILSHASAKGRNITVTINPCYFDLLVSLAPGYTRMLCGDVVVFKSKYSMMIYQHCMRLNSKGKEGLAFTTKELKEMFGLSKTDYVYKDKRTGKEAFSRSLFEKYTINYAVKEINDKSKCIQNLRYEKDKRYNKVFGYVFYFDYIDPKDIS